MRMNDTENYSFKELIATLEQKGAIHILIYLDEKKNANLSKKNPLTTAGFFRLLLEERKLLRY